MNKYDTIMEIMQARHRITVATDQTLTITAAELRKLGKGTAYIRPASHIMGICRDGAFLPPASDAPRKAKLVLGAPETDAERAKLAAAAHDYLRDHPGVTGSAYDPVFADQWAAYRDDMARIEAAS